MHAQAYAICHLDRDSKEHGTGKDRSPSQLRVRFGAEEVYDTIYDMMMMVKIHMSLKKPVKLDLHTPGTEYVWHPAACSFLSLCGLANLHPGTVGGSSSS